MRLSKVEGKYHKPLANQPTNEPGWLLQMTLLYPAPLLMDMPRTESTKSKRLRAVRHDPP
ncbi:hypothetical protein PanWU01x14_197790 [Parasponia andersonii]|uniref:Uncharacterized protein n=1 Tax=Parasponia andersonii TaxID=3476 RepID=A0A2P5BZ60_PARAD|nr:hypothetical protein PanWU01x14_197790 [Parasponia andersonii]